MPVNLNLNFIFDNYLIITMISAIFIFVTYTLCTWPAQGNTNYVCDQFNCCVIKQVTSTSWEFAIGHNTVFPFQSLVLTKSLFLRASASIIRILYFIKEKVAKQRISPFSITSLEKPENQSLNGKHLPEMG